ncbi:MAG TPA: HAD-IIIC family phosphatase [Azospirillum sp.]|nr:HAD-IIIC family phosphatase [Azospirillum sp.]
MGGAESSLPPSAPRLKVYLAGNATLRPMAAGIREGALAAGVDAMVKDAPADQLGPMVFDPASAFHAERWDVAVLHLSSLGLTSAGTAPRDGVAGDLAAVVAAIRSRSDARVAVVLPEPLEEEWDPSSPLAAWRAGVVADIRAALDDRVLVIDPTPTLLEVGAANWYAARFWYHAKLPCHPTALAALGRRVGRSIAAAAAPPVKVVACDLDNVLWGGIVGEDGCHGIALDVHGGGGPFIRLQAYLKHLAGRGILLAAVSKNNPDDVRAVFRERPEMLLGWDDFACVHANWEPKSVNLRAIAEELNLGLQSVAFLDDSPFERAEVRAALPQVTVPELPAAPEDYVPFLVRSGLFATPFVTGEDRERQRHYRENRARRDAAQAAPDLAGFLDSLELAVVALPIDSATIERSVQLIGKTNQFNLTGRRHGAAVVRAMADDPAGFARCFRVTDRFGDNGITGVLIAVPDGADGCRIDTWVLSCRVMGRTVERAMFATLVDWAVARGVRWIVGEHVPSDRNQPVAGLLPELGFERGGDGLYRYDAAHPYTGNRHVRVAGTE